jgi:TetR/AcrR family transcriptional regulator, transcriptional repressor of aconitase
MALVKSERSLYFVLMPKVSEEHLAARRRQILDAALVCFSRNGFHQTSMQAIFDESGLSPGAVYRYFKGKEEIVQAIALETLVNFASAVESGPPGGPDVVLGRLLDAIDAVPLRDDRMRLALQIWGEAIVNPRVGDFVREAIERLRRRMAAELLVPDPDATARVLVALVQGMVIQRDMYADEFDADEFRAAALALVSQPEWVSRQEG